MKPRKTASGEDDRAEDRFKVQGSAIAQLEGLAEALLDFFAREQI